MTLLLDPSVAASRIARVREMMGKQDVHGLIVPISGDLEWLIGHSAFPLERLTALVITLTNKPVLIVPDLEYPGVNQMPDVFMTVKWGDGEQPYSLITDLLPKSECLNLAVGGRMWAQHLIEIQYRFSKDIDINWEDASKIIPPLRRCKDEAEVVALRTVSECVDQVVLQIQEGYIEFKGRTERQVAEEINRLMIECGHDKVDFVLVSTGANAAIPHHMPDDTVIGDGILLFDIGGTKNGYHSDTTRCVHIGQPTDDVWEAYGVLREAQEAAVQAVKPGAPASYVDMVARAMIEERYPGKFIHRTGHGIGMDEHEHPFIASDNQEPLEVGNAFSIEPGIYLEGRWGMRLEDIVVVTPTGCERLNQRSRELVVIKG